MKIKTLLIVGLLFSVANIFAQIPTGYYDGTAGLTGAAQRYFLSERSRPRGEHFVDFS